MAHDSLAGTMVGAGALTLGLGPHLARLFTAMSVGGMPLPPTSTDGSSPSPLAMDAIARSVDETRRCIGDALIAANSDKRIGTVDWIECALEPVRAVLHAPSFAVLDACRAEGPIVPSSLEQGLAQLQDPGELAPTPEHARIFLSTGTTFDAVDNGSYTFQLYGNRGSQQFTFASGTDQSDIVAAINQFRGMTAIHALQDPSDPALVALVSVRKGSRQYVAARRVDGALDGAILDENRSNGANRQFDRGR